MSADKTNWGKVVAIVASVLGVIAIAICAAFSLLLGWCQSALQPDPTVAVQGEAHITLREFLTALERGDVNGARMWGTDRFREEWTAPRLEELSRRMADRLGKRSIATWGDVQLVDPDEAEQDEAGFEYTARCEKGPATVRFVLAPTTEGVRKIDQFEIESELLRD